MKTKLESLQNKKFSKEKLNVITGGMLIILPKPPKSEPSSDGTGDKVSA